MLYNLKIIIANSHLSELIFGYDIAIGKGFSLLTLSTIYFTHLSFKDTNRSALQLCIYVYF